MLTNNTFTIIRKLVVFVVVGSLAWTGLTTTAAAADATMVAALAPARAVLPVATVANPLSEKEFHGNVAEQVRSVVYAQLTEAERKNLAGATAEIEVKYSENGLFEMASVSSNGINKLVPTIHGKIAWKSLPATGYQKMALTTTTAKMKVAIKSNGEVNVQLNQI